MKAYLFRLIYAHVSMGTHKWECVCVGGCGVCIFRYTVIDTSISIYTHVYMLFKFI